jgi:hypothetical protein
MSGKFIDNPNNKLGGYRRKSLKRINRKLSKLRSLRRPKQVRVPFMVTESMRIRLRSNGYSDDDLYRMDPKTANDILNLLSLGYTKEEISQLSPSNIASILKIREDEL